MTIRDNHYFTFRPLLVSLITLISPLLQAQWLTQSFQLTNGWNAIYLHVDASHLALNQFVGNDSANPILEVWRWNPGSSLQFVDNPQDPIDTGSQWINWVRGASSSPLQRMAGNSAYLIRVGTNVSTFTWNIKGKPVPPANEWTTTGLNFVGFPTVPTNPPFFEDFLSRSAELQQNAEIYYYRGGNLGSGNPARLIMLRTAPVRRGQAFWVRSGPFFNRYFGPFDVDFQNPRGVEFGDNLTTYTLRLKNLTTSNLTVQLRLLSSESVPSGQTNIAGLPPLLIRGAINFTNLAYTFTNLPGNTTRSWTLPPKGQPGSEVELVIGLNRSAITQAAGTHLAGILRFTDSLGHSQVDAPVSATAGSTAGLWIGQALVSEVAQYLKTYLRDSQNNPVISSNGQYVATSTNTSLGGVARSFPLRLIVHNPGTGGNAALLQRIFVGPGPETNFVVANHQSAIHPQMLSQARRISSSHFPWTENNSPWTFSGRLSSAAPITTRVDLSYNDHASNPFLHSYHPDHDNLDASFRRVLSPGSESYTVHRQVTLSVNPPGNDFASLIGATDSMQGTYLEQITVSGLPRAGNTSDTREFQVQGKFTLSRISDTPTLTIVP